MRNDFLQKKTAKLHALQAKSQSALDMVTRTISNLQMANDEIAATLGEIEDYKAKLASQEAELESVHNKNCRIIENFARLIEG